MISQFAIEEIEELAARGIQLTPAEIIRLNALGLRAERGEGAWYDVYLLPRAAFLGDLVFREPTVEHELWLDEARRLCDMDHSPTILALSAFAFTRPAEDLPDLTRSFARARLVGAVKAALREFRKFTWRQIDCACLYVAHGVDPAIDEDPEPDDRPVERPPMDETFSVAIGRIFRGVAVSAGLSVGDAKRLTRRQLRAAELKAYVVNPHAKKDDSLNRPAMDDFHRTVDALVAAHSPGPAGRAPSRPTNQ